MPIPFLVPVLCSLATAVAVKVVSDAVASVVVSDAASVVVDSVNNYK